MSSGTSRCLNCGYPISNHYCANCGQKSDVKRLDWHSLFHEIIHFFTHIENGFKKTVATLIIEPGKLYKDYLDGKRKNYHKPVSFLLIWIAIFLGVYNLCLAITHFPDNNVETLISNDVKGSALVNKYRTILELLIMPFTTFTSWLIIGWPKLNYVEILSITFYTISFLFISNCIEFLFAVIFGLNFKTNEFDMISAAIFSLWGLYAFYNFFHRYKIKYLIPKILAAWIACSLVWFIIVKFFIRMMLKMNMH